jgi:hypothetical protein
MRHVTAILFVLSLSSHALHAQAVVPGARVRITSPQHSLNSRVGEVLSERGDTIVVRFHGLNTVRYRQVWTDDTLTLARNTIDRFEVSAGSNVRPGTGCLAGTSVGVARHGVGHKRMPQFSYQPAENRPGGAVAAPFSARASHCSIVVAHGNGCSSSAADLAISFMSRA